MVSRCSFVSTMPEGQHIGPSDLAAAILELWLPLSQIGVFVVSFEMLGPKIVGYHSLYEIHITFALVVVLVLPACNSDFRFHRSVATLVSFEMYGWENGGLSVGITFP